MELNPYTENQDQILSEYIKLQSELMPLPLRQPGSIRAFGWEIEYVSGPAVIANIQYQVLKRINDFFADNDRPLIIDLGANIGISVLNYKRQYPGARVIAFEPDPVFLPVLRKNIESNRLTDIEVVDAAAWIENGNSNWYSEGIDGSKLINSSSMPSHQVVNVRTIDIADYLNQEVDLIKMDVEGAEYKLIPHLAGKLGSVKNLSIECHVLPDLIDDFCHLIELLSSEGYHVNFNTYGHWIDLVRHYEVPVDHFEQYCVVSASRKKVVRQPAWGIAPSADIGLVTHAFQVSNKSMELEQLLNEFVIEKDQLATSYNMLSKDYEVLVNAYNELNQPFLRYAMMIAKRKLSSWSKR